MPETELSREVSRAAALEWNGEGKSNGASAYGYRGAGVENGPTYHPVVLRGMDAPHSGDGR